MTEIYRTIEGYEGLYEVSNMGNVRSLNYHRTGKSQILKQLMNQNGYLSVNLYKSGKMKTFKVHRLVAEAFLPNPQNLPQVNHKNENKTDNRLENLERCSAEYNINYGTRNQRISEALRGRTLSEEHKRKMVEHHVGMKGKHHSEEAKRKMSESTKLYWKNRKSAS